MRIELEDNKKEDIKIDKEENADGEEIVTGALGSYTEDSLEAASLGFFGKMKYKKQQFKNNTANMTFAGKIKYTFSFYWFEMVVAAVFVVIAVIAGNLIYRASLPDLLHVAIINQYYDDDTVNKYIASEYRNYLGADDKNVVTVYKNMSVSANEDPEFLTVVLTDYQTLGHYNLNNMLDVMICDEDALQVYAWSEDTTMIHIAMDEELYDKVKDHAVMLTDKNKIKNDGKEYPGALDITDTEFAKNLGIDYSPVYLLIPSTKGVNNETTLNFIKMVYGL